MISAFYGILIRMFFNDHAPPHFHARYGEFEATIDLSTLEIMEGDLPQRVLSLTREWPMIHKEELLEDWRLCRGTRRQLRSTRCRERRKLCTGMSLK